MPNTTKKNHIATNYITKNRSKLIKSKLRNKKPKWLIKFVAETRRAIAETNETITKNNEEIKKSFAEVNSTIDKHSVAIDRLHEDMVELKTSFKEMSKQIGSLHNSFGKFTESLLLPGVTMTLSKCGYNFGRIDYNIPIWDESGRMVSEIDMMLSDGVTFAVVEVKMTVREDDIEHHINRMKLLRKYLEGRGVMPKSIIGVMLGIIFPDSVIKAVCDAGLYAISQNGIELHLVVPYDFKPHEF
ncbi:MAG: hypothetical protein LBP59_05750 [Planctomycetaceae bacterium]|jgi:hypothetical protein|nr:hypothetical protein [Planctomycetaceae bacterium]